MLDELQQTGIWITAARFTALFDWQAVGAIGTFLGLWFIARAAGREGRIRAGKEAELIRELAEAGLEIRFAALNLNGGAASWARSAIEQRLQRLHQVSPDDRHSTGITSPVRELIFNGELALREDERGGLQPQTLKLIRGRTSDAVLKLRRRSYAVRGIPSFAQPAFEWLEELERQRAFGRVSQAIVDPDRRAVAARFRRRYGAGWRGRVRHAAARLDAYLSNLRHN